MDRIAKTAVSPRQPQYKFLNSALSLYGYSALTCRRFKRSAETVKYSSLHCASWSFFDPTHLPTYSHLASGSDSSLASQALSWWLDFSDAVSHHIGALKFEYLHSVKSLAPIFRNSDPHHSRDLPTPKLLGTPG
jgi:hypothetical protein